MGIGLITGGCAVGALFEMSDSWWLCWLLKFWWGVAERFVGAKRGCPKGWCQGSLYVWTFEGLHQRSEPRLTTKSAVRDLGSDC